VLENVPFMLSLDGGRAIRTIVQALEEMGFSWAYRTIDNRAFGLPQRRRRVILLASQTDDPRPVLLGAVVSAPAARARASHACGFYWTEGNTGLGWAVDAVPPLKGGSALQIPSPPAIWFPKRRLVAVPAIEDAERLQGFDAGWTDVDEVDPKASRKRWRMVGNAVSVPMAKWIAEQLSAPVSDYRPERSAGLPINKGWPGAAWGCHGQRRSSQVSEWPTVVPSPHLAAFLEHKLTPLSKKATSGFYSRLTRSSLRYEETFARDLAHHIKHGERD
jgi:DNA (cytosine-5)-methyltransferase 1